MLKIPIKKTARIISLLSLAGGETLPGLGMLW
jgi:hypothetical protein